MAEVLITRIGSIHNSGGAQKKDSDPTCLLPRRARTGVCANLSNAYLPGVSNELRHGQYSPLRVCVLMSLLSGDDVEVEVEVEIDGSHPSCKHGTIGLYELLQGKGELLAGQMTLKL
jgi:hypothetical protein